MFIITTITTNIGVVDVNAVVTTIVIIATIVSLFIIREYR